jgi:hypothetical protein
MMLYICKLGQEFVLVKFIDVALYSAKVPPWPSISLQAPACLFLDQAEMMGVKENFILTN